MQLPFQYTYLLWLLLLLPLLAAVYFYVAFKKKKVFKSIGDPELVAELTSNHRRASFPQKFFLLLAAMALILLSIANLRNYKGGSNTKLSGIDLMIALDVSKSMLAQDVQPSRLDRARQLLSKLIDRLGTDRVGLVVFAGRAYLQMPLTSDHAAAKMFLSAATTETVPTQGTVIGDALKMCNACFNPKEKKYKAIILISDGEDHDEKAEKVAAQMSAEGVVINTVGIGSAEGAPIMDAATNALKKDNAGNTVITKLNEGALRAIAKEGNGSYRLYTSTEEAVSSLYNELASLDKKEIKDNSPENYESFFQWLLGASLLFLIIEQLISEVKKTKSQKIKAVALSALLLTGNLAFSQTNKTLKEGNKAFKEKDYKTAAVIYESAVAKDPENPKAQYNMGAALYKTGDKEKASKAFETAGSGLKVPQEKSKALYNNGVFEQSKTGEQALDACIVLYKSALKADPANADARHNLQIALQQKQKKKEENSGGGGGEQKPEKKKPSGGMSQKEAEQQLGALMQKEKELQDKLHKVSAATPNTPEKDW